MTPQYIKPCNPVGLLLYAGFVLLLTSCSTEHPSERLFSDYQERIANILNLNAELLDKEALTANHPALISLPRRNLRHQALTDFRISAWEYLQTYECALNLLISERNSSLGKVMPATRRLSYETQLIVEIERCIRQLNEAPETNQKLIDELRDITAQKKPELKPALWNALFAGPEFEDFASVAVKPLAPAEFEPLRIAHESLDELYGISQDVAMLQAGTTEENIAAEQLESPLHKLATQQTLGRFQQSVQLVIRELDSASALLHTELEQPRLCPQGQPTTRARYLQNVFHSQFVQKVQPYLSMLDRDGVPLIGGLRQLLSVHQPDDNNTVVRYIDDISQLITTSEKSVSFDAVVQRHVKAWQDIFANCGLSPRR